MPLINRRPPKYGTYGVKRLLEKRFSEISAGKKKKIHPKNEEIKTLMIKVLLR